MSNKKAKTGRKSLITGLLLGFLGMGVIMVIIYKFPSGPQFIKLGLDPPVTTIGSGSWHNTQSAVLKWSDSQNKYYIWRMETRASIDVYESWMAIANYFDTQLVDKGWEKHPSAFSLCRSLSESSFLPQGENGYIAYLRKQDDPTKLSAVTCLAIWPYSYADSIQGYNVVVEITNPSPLTKYRDSIE